METEKFMAKPTIVSMAAPDYAQELTFEKLFMYYGAQGVAAFGCKRHPDSCFRF